MAQDQGQGAGNGDLNPVEDAPVCPELSPETVRQLEDEREALIDARRPMSVEERINDPNLPRLLEVIIMLQHHEKVVRLKTERDQLIAERAKEGELANQLAEQKKINEASQPRFLEIHRELEELGC